MRDQPVQSQSRSKSTNNRLNPPEFRQKAAEEHHKQYKNVMQVFLPFGFLEKPFGNSWNEQENNSGKNDQRHQQFQQEDQI
ncbi:hypothetical protein SDC9_93827 [bioreactor metagenome]|uniref:Uncharacterized protein n=1 Tax=bioreactor metagenome TaxID=1076179 RepID=A0A645A1N6_9ZZZZ